MECKTPIFRFPPQPIIKTTNPTRQWMMILDLLFSSWPYIKRPFLIKNITDKDVIAMVLNKLLNLVKSIIKLS